MERTHLPPAVAVDADPRKIRRIQQFPYVSWHVQVIATCTAV
jgi:hypothetical protein